MLLLMYLSYEQSLTGKFYSKLNFEMQDAIKEKRTEEDRTPILSGLMTAVHNTF
jgi:hypothetical protein